MKPPLIVRFAYINMTPVVKFLTKDHSIYGTKGNGVDNPATQIFLFLTEECVPPFKTVLQIVF